MLRSLVGAVARCGYGGARACVFSSSGVVGGPSSSARAPLLQAKASLTSLVLPRLTTSTAPSSSSLSSSTSTSSFFGNATRAASLLLGRAAQCPATKMSVRQMGHARALKTKKSAAKRFIVTGKGALKRGHAYKGHLTSHKSKTRLRKLNSKVLLTGVWAKKMKMLILNGK